MLCFPFLELLPLGLTVGTFLLHLVETFLLIRLEHGADIALGLVLLGLDLVFQRFLISGWQFFQVLLDQLLAIMHLLAHQLANLLALFAAQVQLAVGSIAATVVFATVTWAH